MTIQMTEAAAGESRAQGPAAVEPKILAFLCNWCSDAGADKAGGAQIVYPPNVYPVRVMCTGRIDPQFVLAAFSKGADGVLILGCHPGDCHYKEQNYRTIQRHRLVLRLLAQWGIAPERCRLDFVSAAEGEKFAATVTTMVESIRALGPIVCAPGPNPQSYSQEDSDGHCKA